MEGEGEGVERGASRRGGRREVDVARARDKCFVYEMSGPALSNDVKAEVDQILEAIIYLYTESRRITKELARRAELTGPQLTVVKMLESVGDLSLSDLSDRIRAQNSTVTGIVDRMEREGLVVRSRSTEDKRVVHIRLTEKGERIAREIPVEPMEIFRSALAGLTATEARDLLRVLTKLARRVQSIVRDGATKRETP
jgi:MarR family transcriptional regulator, organic hydroperoxide resistance regulator